jgi:predicted TIM-barrel fold metal-dependent hydrolase
MSPLRPIDCDVHPPPPPIAALLPYLDRHWRDSVIARGIDGFDLVSYPPNSPLSFRPDWRPASYSGSPLEAMQRHILDPWGTECAILNCLHGAMAVFGDDLSAALVRAVNDWLAEDWLGRDPRLRGSILLPARSPALAAAEIEHRAPDRRFVQVLLPVSAAMPLGRREYWPIYEAAHRHGLPVGIHAGSIYHHPLTPSGWPSYLVEDYISQAQAFQNQLVSLIAEGVFVKFPGLRVVLIESGFSWMPSFMMRADKTWRGLRSEAPWLDRPPSAIIRDHVRMTLQPVDGPPDPAPLRSILRHIGSDQMLLFSTDYPHWQFEGMDAIPPCLDASELDHIARSNPLATYPRLHQEGVAWT